MKNLNKNITVLFVALIVAFLYANHSLANDYCSQLRVTTSPVNNYSKTTNRQDIEFQTNTEKASKNKDVKAYIKLVLQHDRENAGMEFRDKTTYILYGVPWGSFSQACDNLNIPGKINRIRVTNAQCIDEYSALQHATDFRCPMCRFDE